MIYRLFLDDISDRKIYFELLVSDKTFEELSVLDKIDLNL